MTDAELEALAYSPAELTSEQLLLIFQAVGARADVLIYKHDGMRSTNRFTVLASISGHAGVCRHDGDLLSASVQECLRQYLAAKKQRW